MFTIDESETPNRTMDTHIYRSCCSAIKVSSPQLLKQHMIVHAHFLFLSRTPVDVILFMHPFPDENRLQGHLPLQDTQRQVTPVFLLESKQRLVRSVSVQLALLAIKWVQSTDSREVYNRVLPWEHTLTLQSNTL